MAVNNDTRMQPLHIIQKICKTATQLQCTEPRAVQTTNMGWNTLSLRQVMTLWGITVLFKRKINRKLVQDNCWCLQELHVRCILQCYYGIMLCIFVPFTAFHHVATELQRRKNSPLMSATDANEHVCMNTEHRSICKQSHKADGEKQGSVMQNQGSSHKIKAATERTSRQTVGHTFVLYGANIMCLTCSQTCRGLK